MADHSVSARDDYLQENEGGVAPVFRFNNASAENSWFVDDLVSFISLCLRVLCSWMPPEGMEIIQRSLLRENSSLLRSR